MKYIKLNHGKRTMVDDEDYYILSSIKWHAVLKKRDNTWSVRGYLNKKHFKMHQFIINPPKGFVVDHKNGNGLDNRKINLRACTNAQNACNRKVNINSCSGLKGVMKRGSKFQARIRFNNKSIYLGVYSSKEEAMRKYDEAAIKYHGEFARTNQMIGLLN